MPRVHDIVIAAGRRTQRHLTYRAVEPRLAVLRTHSRLTSSASTCIRHSSSSFGARLIAASR